MRVLITGVAGFIGSHLAERLLDQGDEVRGWDTLRTGRMGNVPDGCHFAIRHVASPDGADPPADLIIHCAASYHDPSLWEEDASTNIGGAIRVAELARQWDAQIVYFQTSLPPTSSYSISKIAGEQYLRLCGQPLLVFRLGNIYGPRNVSGPIPAFYQRLSQGLPCTVTDTSRDIVYIDDLVECVMMALRRRAHGTFDVCTGHQTSILDQWRAVHAAMPLVAAGYGEQFDARSIAEPDVVPAGADDVPPQVSAGRGLIGWSAATPLEHGVREAVAWYAANGVRETYTHLTLKG